jgi:hypothetical protein
MVYDAASSGAANAGPLNPALVESRDALTSGAPVSAR